MWLIWKGRNVKQGTKRRLAAFLGWLVVQIFGSLIIGTIVGLGSSTGIEVAVWVFFALTAPATLAILIWELGGRRIWVMIVTVLFIPSLVAGTLIFLGSLDDINASGWSLVAQILTTLAQSAALSVFGQVGQVIGLPAAAVYWVTSHFLLSRWNGHPRKKFDAKDIDQVFT